jgi:DNA gyrase subunit B
MVSSVVHEQLTTAFEEDPQTRKRIIEKAITAARAREAAKKASELVKRKSGLDNPDLPGKLKDCRSRNPAECEMFIVEGDSAGGNAETARDSRFQAVLPIRGKTINVEKHRLDKILANNEIRAIVGAIGAGMLNGAPENGSNGNGGGNGEFDPGKLRYHRIILMTDADVDGAHIRTLLLAFFFRYMAPLIEKGHVYIAQLPLYSLKTAREQRYVYTDEELERVRSEMKGRNLTITRFKGLAEMNADQLADTGMNPQTRTLLQVTLDDAAKADSMFSVLMGSEVGPRREFIVEHAREVRNLDI